MFFLFFFSKFSFIFVFFSGQPYHEKPPYLFLLKTLLLRTLEKTKTPAFAFSLPSSLYQSPDRKRNGRLLKGLVIPDQSLIRKGWALIKKDFD